MRFDELIDQMTLQEKASLLSGDGWWKTRAIERLGIPSVYVADGPHGLRIQDDSVKKPGDSRRAVCFPSGTGLASSFNREMIYEVGTVLGEECKNEVVDVVLGPALNMKRSPLCGRNFEYMSEDPYLAGQMASSYVKGIQSTGTGVSIKHFAANNQEKHRMTVSAIIDERAFREIYLAAYEEIVKSAAPDTVMCSYNKINGVYSSENPKLLNDILRDEWGFEGLVMSDWGAVCDRVKGVPAGLDLEMPGSWGINEEKLIEAVVQGDLDEEALDNAVLRVLKLVDKHTGFLSENTGNKADSRVRTGFDYAADHKKARRFAREAMVLLKNEGALPLNKDEKILFVGEFAEKPRIQGGGSSHVHCAKIVGALKASERYAQVDYAQGYDLKDEKNDEFLIEEALEKAEKADKVVIFAGLPDSYEYESADRKNMRMPKSQNKLIREIGKINKNTIVVLHNGSPVEMPWVKCVNSILEAYLGGEASGEAVADLLFGAANPSGKLAETFPVKLSDNPSFNNFPGEMTVEYRESIFIGYRYYDKVAKEVLFPFGHGLSYTTFEYSDIKLDKNDKNVKVSFKLKNTGAVAGAEAAQVYVRMKNSKTYRPVQELKGFEKLYLEPGEEKEISIELNERAFAYYNTKLADWYVEPGDYCICVGSSSRDIRLNAEIRLDNPVSAEPEFTAEQLPGYFSGDPAAITAQEFEILYGSKLPASEKPKNAPLTLRNTLEDCLETKWGGRIYKFLNVIINGKAAFMGEKQKSFNLDPEVPLNTMICMSNGKLTLREGKAIVGLLNEENILENLGILTDAVTKSMKKKSQARKNEREEKKQAKKEQKNNSDKKKD